MYATCATFRFAKTVTYTSCFLKGSQFAYKTLFKNESCDYGSTIHNSIKYATNQLLLDNDYDEFDSPAISEAPCATISSNQIDRKQTQKIENDDYDNSIYSDERELSIYNSARSMLDGIPANHDEVNAAIEILRSSPEACSELIPQGLQIDLESLVPHVFGILTRHDVLQTHKSKPAAVTNSTFKAKSSEPSSTAWDKLRECYPCSICQDVLAAPVIINTCGHNFCGACLIDYKDSCISEDAQNEVVNKCCSCRTEFESLTFERILDETICREVAALPPDCPKKIDWEERRQVYLSPREAATAAGGGKGGFNNMDTEMSSLDSALYAGAILAVITAVCLIIKEVVRKMAK